MRLVWVGYGLLALGATGALAIELTFRASERDAREQRSVVDARLEPVSDEDFAWPGRYQLSLEEIVLHPGGSFHESLMDNPDEDLLSFRERSGTWRREGSRIVLSPDDRTRAREFELGQLDGDYVLLSEFAVWRRVPDAGATSSSR